MNLAAFIQTDTLSLLEKAKDKIEHTAQTEGFFEQKIIQTAKFSITVWDLIAVALIILITSFVIYLMKRGFMKNKRIDAGKRYSLFSLTRYVIIVIAFLWSLDVLGVRLTLLLGGSAALLVGVGLGLQNLFSDFVSGIVLLADSSIKVGDVIDVDGLVCQVLTINLRTTQVLTRDDKYILLPNTLITKNRIINWTHSNESSRFEVSVGAGYDSDAHLVKRLLLEVIDEVDGILKQPAPFVRFNDFSSSTLLFTVYFWSRNVFRVENLKSEIRFKIYDKFNKYHIDISLPQRVVHFYDKERGEDFVRYTKDDFID
ncbi:MAG: mechanosensitive ion channel [Petrimonas sp.]|nr:mechanosensitive ion channel [Petrimonas sp.]